MRLLQRSLKTAVWGLTLVSFRSQTAVEGGKGDRVNPIFARRGSTDLGIFGRIFGSLGVIWRSLSDQWRSFGDHFGRVYRCSVDTCIPKANTQTCPGVNCRTRRTSNFNINLPGPILDEHIKTYNELIYSLLLSFDVFHYISESRGMRSF